MWIQPCTGGVVTELDEDVAEYVIKAGCLPSDFFTTASAVEGKFIKYECDAAGAPSIAVCEDSACGTCGATATPGSECAIVDGQLRERKYTCAPVKTESAATTTTTTTTGDVDISTTSTVGGPVGTPMASVGCHAGTEACPCIDGACLTGLSCLSNTCVKAAAAQLSATSTLALLFVTIAFMFAQ
jgi:hypothetical protein